jgi:iron complex transport system permease protein
LRKNQIVILALSLLAVGILAIAFGSSGVGPGDIWKWIFQGKDSEVVSRIILSLRIPQVVASILTGAALGLAGYLSQTLFRNDLADPYIAGIASGAMFGVYLTLLTGATLSVLGVSSLSVSAFLGAWTGALVVWGISGKTGTSGSGLVLSGVALSFVFSGLNYLIVLVGRDILNKSTFWSWSGLKTSSWVGVTVMALSIVIVLAMLPLLKRNIDAYLLGDEAATYLGVNPKRLRMILFLLVAILTGSAVATSGILGFVGLIIPHICRRFFGSSSKVMIPSTMLAGSIVLVLADLIGRVIIPYQEIPAQVTMSLAGGAFFIYLLTRRSFNA